MSSLLAITRYKFSLPLYSTVQLCSTLSHLTEPTQSNTKRSVDFQPCTHAHSMRCPHAYAMQCAIACYVMPHDECYMDNAKTVHFTVHHGQLYPMHTISIQSHNPCQYIYTHIYQHLIIQLPTSMLFKTKQQHP